MLGDGRIFRLRDVADVDDRVRAQRLADFIERDPRDRKIGEQRLVALHEIAEDPRQSEMIGMNLDRRRRENEIGSKVEQDLAKAWRDAVVELAIGSAQELDRDVFAEVCECPTRFLFAYVRPAGLRAVRGHDHAHLAPLAQMLRDEPATSDHFVVGVRCEDEQPFAAELSRFIRNRLRLDEHGRIVATMASRVRGMASDEVERTQRELARLRAEHRQISDLLALIQELTSRVIRSESAGELFSGAFPTLLRCLPFDVAVAVMFEQNLDLYVATREGADALVSDHLVRRIRETLARLIPVSFESTDVVVVSETHHLERRDVTGLRHEAAALLEHEKRTAGLLLLCREESEFSESERQVLAIFSTQMSMLLGTIRARERIVNLADTDDLTGIWNKRHFRRQLPQEIERARTFNVPLSLLLFDIDDFKQINDGFGHVMGDVVLSELCAVVRETLRPTDTIARFGGDEFAVILPHTDLAGATAVAERILLRVRALTIPTDEEAAIQCSISIGLAEFVRDDASASDLIRRADERLYLAKRQGKNRYTA